jgi:hypothetical protein
VQDGAGEQGVGRLFPVVPPFLGALRVDQDVGDILYIAHFHRSFAHFEQRIEAGRQGIGRIEQQAVRELRAPAGGQRPVLTLDVVDNGRARP